MLSKFFEINSSAIKVMSDTVEIFQQLPSSISSKRISQEGNPTLETSSSVSVSKSDEKFLVPQKAILTNSNADRGTMEYQIDDVHIYFRKDFCITINPTQSSIYIKYKKHTDELNRIFIQAVRWAIITASHKKGWYYLPGQVLQFKSKNLIISGQPEHGKRDCLSLLADNRARLLAINALIHRAGDSLFSFDVGYAGKERKCLEVLERFPSPHSKVNKLKIDHLIFVNSWSSSKSKFESVSAKEASARLTQLNAREYELLTAYQRSIIQPEHHKLCSNIACTQLFLGTDTENSIQALIDICSNSKTCSVRNPEI